ncbi:MAG: biopolymer transporter ExbD [Planctomycetota bacterium]
MTRDRHGLRGEDEGSALMPLMDVMLSVLAGVMYCLTIAEFGGQIDVYLPGVAAAAPTQPVDNVEVSFDAAGAYYVADRPVERTGLTAALRAAIGVEGRPVVIRGDRAAPFEVSVVLYEAAREAGASHVLVATRDRR